MINDAMIKLRDTLRSDINAKLITVASEKSYLGTLTPFETLNIRIGEPECIEGEMPAIYLVPATTVEVNQRSCPSRNTGRKDYQYQVFFVLHTCSDESEEQAVIDLGGYLEAITRVLESVYPEAASVVDGIYDLTIESEVYSLNWPGRDKKEENKFHKAAALLVLAWQRVKIGLTAG